MSWTSQSVCTPCIQAVTYRFHCSPTSHFQCTIYLFPSHFTSALTSVWCSVAPEPLLGSHLLNPCGWKNYKKYNYKFRKIFCILIKCILLDVLHIQYLSLLYYFWPVWPEGVDCRSQWRTGTRETEVRLDGCCEGDLRQQRNDGGGCATMFERPERVESPGT